MTQPPFCCIPSGRALTTAFEQSPIDKKKFLLKINALTSIKHITVCLTGAIELPGDAGAAVYFSFDDGKNFEFLGGISNFKPSATFRMNWLKRTDEDADKDGLIGLIIEPLTELEEKQKHRIEHLSPHRGYAIEKVGKKVVANQTRYLSSFAVSVPSLPGISGGTYIPERAFKKWMDSFDRRIRFNPEFWSDLP
ncbi:OPI10 family like protein [Aduncisulcus paluster]|uniref:OPI10 family like protein n=1 Tax=Aduncisulcus paluster TaxID=2918883 RepID=A0ABQ5K3A6_9EUKA|nr:OPI10 family like protein [Aduncisulcus paluster]|eukprot:gnl/Carplike_NY0171/224_a325_4978.p1 GENE.gnl/Carplike_NY0171/224_a325_4978~~gnl/Carplike_NY0171/224_a325_4978.p1  ORF type:complete len:194 (-),score=39.58 gnl/Carplike_NY0171/224_a325_4978:123-704(-)